MRRGNTTARDSPPAHVAGESPLWQQAGCEAGVSATEGSGAASCWLPCLLQGSPGSMPARCTRRAADEKALLLSPTKALPQGSRNTHRCPPVTHKHQCVSTKVQQSSEGTVRHNSLQQTELSAELFQMGLSLCGPGPRETMYNKPLCGKLHRFKASFASRGEKASVSLFHMPSPTPRDTGKQ